MDPLTLLATVNAAYNGIKKVVAAGREAQDIYKQLSKWADHAGKLYDYISKTETDVGVFKTIKFGKSETAEAFDIIAAKMRLKQMEEEIRNMFYYGELQDLGMAGYRDFIALRKQIREKREAAVKEQVMKRRRMAENAFWSFILFVVFIFVTYWLILLYEYGKNVGRW